MKKYSNKFYKNFTNYQLIVTYHKYLDYREKQANDSVEVQNFYQEILLDVRKELNIRMRNGQIE